MDIGAAISKKIQMAITAKLKELNAYVDDELPDYIMIMVANRKTESQMREALSLFLSDNTEGFTSWLHSLLATLRRTKTDKKDDSAPKRKSSESAQVGKEGLSLNQGEVRKDIAPREPVITINPESDDVLDKELQADIPSSNVSKSRSSIPGSRAKKSTSSKFRSRKSSSNSTSDHQKDRKRTSNEESLVLAHDKWPKKLSKSNKGSLSSTVSQVIQNSSFVSDNESDDDGAKPKVSSKVAYPRRKMRVPLNKQANKALLMRAVSEAEKSVRGRDDNSEEMGKGRIAGMKNSPTAPIRQLEQDQQPRSMKQKKKLNQRATKIRRQIDVAESLLQSQKVPGGQKASSKVISPQEVDEQSSTAIVVKSRRKRVSRPKSDAEERYHPLLVSDARKFILQDAQTEEINKAISPVKFDSRLTKRHVDVPIQGSFKSVKKQRITARVTPRPHNADDQRAMAMLPGGDATSAPTSSSGPVFIVTLDGVVSSKQTKFKTIEYTDSVSESNVQNQQIATIPCQQSNSITQEVRHPQVLTKLQKPATEQVVNEDVNQRSTKHPANTELEQMKRKMLELQTEAAKLKKMQATLVATRNKQQENIETDGSGQLEDQCSISISNVHYSTTEKQLSDFFSICGKVSRVTLLKDKKTLQPTGFAYLEFESKRAVSSALALNNSRFNERVIKVTLKQNRPVLPFPTSLGRYHPRRLTRVRGFRGPRFRQNVHRYTSKFGIQKPQARNRTWVNPLLAKK